MYREGAVLPSNNYGDFVIVDRLSHPNFRIKFLDTGYEVVVRRDSVRKGVVRDLYKPTAYGVGFIGSGRYFTNISSRPTLDYSCWKSILRRCYDTEGAQYEVYGGRGVTVHPHWHNFQNFAEWYEENHREGFEVDKDWKNPGSKMYSEENCEFIPEHINKLIGGKNPKNLPRGVVSNKKKYQARMHTLEGMRRLGSFNTPEQAFVVYKQAKEAYIKEVATEHYNLGNITLQVYENLIAHEVLPYPDEGIL